MSAATKNVAVLGLDREHRHERVGGDRRQRGSAAGGGACRPTANLARLLEQARQFRPRWIVATDETLAARVRLVAACRRERNCSSGREALAQVAAAAEVDVVLAAIVGSAGLRSTWAALEAKKTVALANKETLVMAGALVTRLARRARRQDPAGRQRTQRDFPGAAGRPAAKKCGGSCSRPAAGRFANCRAEQLKQVTVDDALCASDLGHGAEDHDRFGHDDEQGAGDHRSRAGCSTWRPSRSKW